MKTTTQKNKNQDQRLRLMAEGMADLQNWLFDFIRQGMATPEARNPDFWKDIAMRMVDTKSGSIARRLRNLALLADDNSEWPEQMLEELANIYLATRGFENLDKLPTPLKGSLLSYAGVSFKKEELLKRAGIEDHWMVLGQSEGTEEKLRFRRTWLQGANSRRMALILDFAWGDAPFAIQWETGSVFAGSVVFYPSSYPLRCLVKEHSAPLATIKKMGGYPLFENFLSAYARALGANPWLFEFPVLLAQATPVLHKGQLYLIDQQHKQLPGGTPRKTGWKLLALSGGHPINIFGEWNGSIFAPLSAYAEDRFVAF